MAFDPVSYAMGAKSGGGSGSGGGALVVHDVNGTLDKTWQEIHDAGAVTVIQTNSNELYCCPVTIIGGENGMYYIGVGVPQSADIGSVLTMRLAMYVTDSASGNPEAYSG